MIVTIIIMAEIRHFYCQWRKIMKNANYNWLADAIKFSSPIAEWGAEVEEEWKKFVLSAQIHDHHTTRASRIHTDGKADNDAGLVRSSRC